MKYIYRIICIPLIQVSNTVYTFVGGILISLATNILTTLCFENFCWAQQWYQYLSIIFFTISSALCLYLSTKMTGVQNYLNSKHKHPDERKKIIIDVTEAEYIKWVVVFLLLFFFIITGIILLTLNFSYSNTMAPCI